MFDNLILGSKPLYWGLEEVFGIDIQVKLFEIHIKTAVAIYYHILN